MTINTPSSQESDFLAVLNRPVPANIDWKKGALNYIAKLFDETEGDLSKRFHLNKPFCSVRCDDEAPAINVQMEEYIREISHFLNILALMSLPGKTRFLDVACGSGWITHFLSKLNLAVVGIDISDDMVELTRERLQIDPVPTVEARSFNKTDLLVHDIEEAKLPDNLHCDVAILESALHHFINPIQSLRHIADSLSDQGIVVIIEGAVDEIPKAHIAIMRKYHTLERPYSREQLAQILEFAGFAEYQFLHPINGFFLQSKGVADCLHDRVLHNTSWNTVIATKKAGTLKKLNLDTPDINKVGPVVGEIGIKGDLQSIGKLAKRVVKKSWRKLKKLG
jgi:SAM-dependent methyltransferase